MDMVCFNNALVGDMKKWKAQQIGTKSKCYAPRDTARFRCHLYYLRSVPRCLVQSRYQLSREELLSEINIFTSFGQHLETGENLPFKSKIFYTALEVNGPL